VFSDPINFIDPNGKIVVNLISAGVGAILGGIDAYMKGESVIKGALIGGVSNLLGGKVVFNAINGLISNLISQASNVKTSTCGSGSSEIKYSQALAAAVMGAINLSSINTANLLSNSSNQSRYYHLCCRAFLGMNKVILVLLGCFLVFLGVESLLTGEATGVAAGYTSPRGITLESNPIEYWLAVLFELSAGIILIKRNLFDEVSKGEK
jgi:hypothetical protein